ncbi:hypothetical protein [Persephonella sp. KM09-Lau-8]|uniref:hypothetical protein n=1 Tax=Persephonella sp. KM09-Lau-8 TaxID=1158345 RepID=UPI000494DE7D|nr:hypothetical protein [Persephonella sp. KM09-Lau-8]
MKKRGSGLGSPKGLMRLEKRVAYRFEESFIYDALTSLEIYKFYISVLEACKEDFLKRAAALSKYVNVSISSCSVSVTGDTVFDSEIDKERLFLYEYALALSDVLNAYCCAKSLFPDVKPSNFEMFTYVKNKHISKLRKLLSLNGDLTTEYLDSLYSRMVKRYVSEDAYEFIDEVKLAIYVYLKYTASRLDGFFTVDGLEKYIVDSFKGSFQDFIERYCSTPEL